VPRVELACGRVGDDGDVMAAQPVSPALRLMAGWAACMTASCCSRVTWRFALLFASVAMLAFHTCFSKENQVQAYMHARIMFHAYRDI
jgi:hypothetical protein